MSKLLSIYKLIEPVLGKKIPLFTQTVSEFGTSKSNWVGISLIAFAITLLCSDIDSTLGMILFTNGIGLISLKDAAANGTNNV